MFVGAVVNALGATILGAPVGFEYVILYICLYSFIMALKHEAIVEVGWRTELIYHTTYIMTMLLHDHQRQMQNVSYG